MKPLLLDFYHRLISPIVFLKEHWLRFCIIISFILIGIIFFIGNVHAFNIDFQVQVISQDNIASTLQLYSNSTSATSSYLILPKKIQSSQAGGPLGLGTNIDEDIILKGNKTNINATQIQIPESKNNFLFFSMIGSIILLAVGSCFFFIVFIGRKKEKKEKNTAKKTSYNIFE
jgi:hypothetical protein